MPKRFAYTHDMMRRFPWPLVVSAALVALLALLATLQYRWLGEVSEAERDRMRAGLRTRATEFARDFDGELTRTYVAFHVSADALDADAPVALADAYAKWRAATIAPALVSQVYLLRGDDIASARLRRLDVDRRSLDDVPWPPDLEAGMRRAERSLPSFGGVPAPALMADAIDSRIPALIIPIRRVTRVEEGGQHAVVRKVLPDARTIVVTLDSVQLQRQLLAPLVAKHFGEADSSEFLVSIARRDDEGTVVFSTGETVSAASADVTAGVFDLLMDELGRFAEARIPGPPPLLNGDRVAITVVRRANGKQTGPVLMSAGTAQGAWQLRVRHRSGSLEVVVAQSRRRNLAISLGVLGLLAASIVLILAAARRQQHAARQQLEFVAAVSHELRTPLAVICSAGENLADGVIADAPQVKRYGALIEAEGRRLHDMVERVLTFAGIASGAAIRLRRDVDVSAVVAEAVTGAAPLAQDRQVTVAVHTSPGVPAIACDPDALRSAVQNVVDNAIKYSHAGATVDVRIESYPHAPSGETGVRIRVEDRGFGIDAADLGRIFVPFFRGRRAIEAQVRGSGIGLSVVRRVVDAHAGDVTIESAVNRGTTVTVTLPPLHLHDEPSHRRAAMSEARV